MNYTFERGYVFKDGIEMSYAEVVDELNLLRVYSKKWNELDYEIGELYSHIDGDLVEVGEICATKLGYL